MRFPAVFFAISRPGRGALSFRQTFANATSDTLYRFLAKQRAVLHKVDPPAVLRHDYTGARIWGK